MYNLACAFSIFSNKEGMLKYVKRAMEMGKTKAQFMDDNDFKKYRKDEEFLNALEQ